MADEQGTGEIDFRVTRAVHRFPGNTAAKLAETTLWMLEPGAVEASANRLVEAGTIEKRGRYLYPPQDSLSEVKP
jgi:hypothetical protein